MGCGSSAEETDKNPPQNDSAPHPSDAPQEDSPKKSLLPDSSDANKDVDVNAGSTPERTQGSHRESAAFVTWTEASAACDEFGEEAVQPLPPLDMKYYSDAPQPKGSEVVTACFEQGLLYHIEDGKNWYFLNTSRNREMEVTYTFASSSQFEALGNTRVTGNGTEGWTAQATCMPGELIAFVRGTLVAPSQNIRVLPVPEEKLRALAQKGYDEAKREREAMPPSTDTDTEEDILRKCVQRRKMFVDGVLIPSQESISAGALREMKTVPWGRPSMYLTPALNDQVRLFRGPISPLNLRPGDLGNSWIIGAISILAEDPLMVRSMFTHPEDPKQTLAEQAVGAYRVTINKDGWWRSVIVDNYLPLCGSLPKYCHISNDPCEVWVSILEKAYAKLHGSYAKIISGDPLLALQDFTGFPVTRYDEAFAVETGRMPSNLLTRLEGYLNAGFSLLFNTPRRDPKIPQLATECKNVGLSVAQVYGVRRICTFPEEGLVLIQVRNPWGDSSKWMGEWRENDPKWTEFPAVKKTCESEKGCIWMTWNEVRNYFSGCGVLFRWPRSIDVRIRGTFWKQTPSVCLLLTVVKKVSLFLTLSQADSRSAVSGIPGRSVYSPLLLSMAYGENSLDRMKVEVNTNMDVDHPTRVFSFMQSRDVGMMCSLVPERSPYLVVPRIMSESISTPYILGLLADVESSTDGLTIEFCTLSEGCTAFENAAVYSAKEMKSTIATYQMKVPGKGFPEVRSTKNVLM